MSMVAVMFRVAASKKWTLWAVLAVTMRLGPPGRLLRSNIASSVKIVAHIRRRRTQLIRATIRKKMQARLREIMDHLREDIKRSTSRNSRRCARPQPKFLGELVKRSRTTGIRANRPGAG